jgi:hypothetical protein
MGQLPKDGTSIQRESHPEVVKKKYASPRLTEYGSLAKLTHGGGGTKNDSGGGGGNTMTCL